MPAYYEKLNIPRRLDRRIKLTEEQREELRIDRKTLGLSYNELARKYHISKRLAMFICNPDKYERAKKQARERRSDGRYKPTKEEWKKVMREHRRYKRSIKDQLITKKD
jgi:hypothetical protein